MAPQLLSGGSLRCLDNPLPVLLLSKPKLVQVISGYQAEVAGMILRFVAPAKEIQEYLVSFANHFSLYPHIKVIH